MIDTHTPPLSTKMLFARIDPADSTIGEYKAKTKDSHKFNLFVNTFEEKIKCIKVVCIIGQPNIWGEFPDKLHH